MHASRFAKVLGIALTALLAFGCDSKSEDSAPPPGEETAQLGWEDAQVDDWNSEANFYSGTDEVLEFTQDTEVVKNGAASLKVLGTLADNEYGDDMILDAGIFLNADGSPIDFLDRTLTTYVRLGAGTAGVDSVAIQLVDVGGGSIGSEYIPVTTAVHGWIPVSFNPTRSERLYVTEGFDVTQVSKVVVRISKPATGAAEVEAYIDSLGWERWENLVDDSTFTLGDTYDFQFYNTGRVELPAENGVWDSMVTDCTPAGLDGNCLKIEASDLNTANPWESAVQFKDGVGPTPGDLAFTYASAKQYKIRFTAKANKNVVVHAYSALPDNPWTTAVDQEFTIGTTVGRFETDWYSPDLPSAAQIAIRFGFAANAIATGAPATVVYIDDIMLLEQ